MTTAIFTPEDPPRIATERELADWYRDRYLGILFALGRLTASTCDAEPPATVKTLTPRPVTLVCAWEPKHRGPCALQGSA